MTIFSRPSVGQEGLRDSELGLNTTQFKLREGVYYNNPANTYGYIENNDDDSDVEYFLSNDISGWGKKYTIALVYSQISIFVISSILTAVRPEYSKLVFDINASHVFIPAVVLNIYYSFMYNISSARVGSILFSGVPLGLFIVFIVLFLSCFALDKYKYKYRHWYISIPFLFDIGVAIYLSKEFKKHSNIPITLYVNLIIVTAIRAIFLIILMIVNIPKGRVGRHR